MMPGRLRAWSRVAWYWLPPLLWVGGVTWLSRGALSDRAPGWLFSRDKLLHALYFGGLALLLMRGLRGERRWPMSAAAVCAFLIAVLYGAWDEFQQGFNPSRTRDIADWHADAIGASVVFVVVLLVRARQRIWPRGKSE